MLFFMGASAHFPFLWTIARRCHLRVEHAEITERLAAACQSATIPLACLSSPLPNWAGRLRGPTGIVMASVLLSRFLGFCREWAVAHQVRSNATTDAYYAAFTLPDFLNYFVAAGSLSVTFIPVFSKYMAEEREEEAGTSSRSSFP